MSAATALGAGIGTRQHERRAADGHPALIQRRLEATDAPQPARPGWSAEKSSSSAVASARSTVRAAAAGSAGGSNEFDRRRSTPTVRRSSQPSTSSTSSAGHARAARRSSWWETSGSKWLRRRCTKPSSLRQNGPERACASATSGGRLAQNDNEPPRRAARVTLNRRRPTLPGPCEPSTIGAEGLNCSVRNGKRCFPLAKATGNLREIPAAPQNRTAHHMCNSRRSKNKTVKPSSH